MPSWEYDEAVLLEVPAPAKDIRHILVAGRTEKQNDCSLAHLVFIERAAASETAASDTSSGAFQAVRRWSTYVL